MYIMIHELAPSHTCTPHPFVPHYPMARKNYISAITHFEFSNSHLSMSFQFYYFRFSNIRKEEEKKKKKPES